MKALCQEGMAAWGTGSEEEQATWAANAQKMMEGWTADKDRLTAEIIVIFNAVATYENKLCNEAQYVEL